MMEEFETSSSNSSELIENSNTHAGVANTASQKQIFTELLELKKYAEDGYQEWTETSRWIKFCETVEPEGNRWSKPHISTPTFSGWLELRKCLHDGIVLVDLEAHSFSHLCELIATELINKEFVNNEIAEQLQELWQKKHRHQFEGPRKVKGMTTVIKDLLVQKLESKAEKSGLQIPALSEAGRTSRRGSIHIPDGEDRKPGMDTGKVNVSLQKKIASNQMEANIILEGAVPFLDRKIGIFVKMKTPLHIGDLPEVDLPTKFLFFFIGPSESENQELYENIGIALATAFTDKDFITEAYNAKDGNDILEAFDAYMSGVRLLPKDWPKDHKIDPPPNVKNAITDEDEEEIDEDRRMREAYGLVRTQKHFGGLLNDIKRKKPFYLSDFFNGLHPQCLSSFLFLYFACLAPIVTFGGLLGQATENRIATIESLVSGLLCGVIFGLFSGQPLILLGSTGPVYVFEKILYQMCKDQDWDYLNLRLWIGLWVAAILIALVALDASAYVCYITRFTEELFAVLIAFIFIFNAFRSIAQIGTDNIFMPNRLGQGCKLDKYDTDVFKFNVSMDQCQLQNGTTIDYDMIEVEYEPNVLLMSIILFTGAFTICISLKYVRNSGFFPGKLRNFLSDFAVIIAIISMTTVDYIARVNTPKLLVPDSFKPTFEGRAWVVTHALMFTDHFLSNPWWVDVLLAPILAILATILIFMDQQITAVIVNRKEHQLKKGGGYHLDLLVLALIIVVCSVFGLPWFVAATVLSINHLQSLRKESDSSAPGEQPQFLGIREQRVTNILIGLCIGLSVLITPILALIPMPVLFGVFLFMGVSSLKGLQFVERLQLLFIPRKYQPDHVYLKYVPLYRVHLFTFIQFGSLMVLWMIKSHPTTSIAFPVMLVVICAIRKVMECLFTRRELRLLDDLLPETKKNVRKGMIGQISRISKHNMAKDWHADDLVIQREALKIEMDRAKKHLKKKAKELGLELESVNFKKETKIKSAVDQDFNLSPPSPEKRQRKSSWEKRSKGSKSKGIPSSSSRSRSPPKDVHWLQSDNNITLFVKLMENEAYMPVVLTEKTVDCLLYAIQKKCPNFNPASVSCSYKRTTKGMNFHLDDDMMHFIQNQQIFNIELKPVTGAADVESFEMILEEIQ